MAITRRLTTADGQVAASTTEIATGPSDSGGRINVTFCNTGTAEETLVLTVTRGSGGTARRLRRNVLQANEQLVVAGLPLSGDDSLKAATTNASVVDYLVSVGPDDSPFTFTVYDESGLPKSAPAVLETLAQLFD